MGAQQSRGFHAQCRANSAAANAPSAQTQAARRTACTPYDYGFQISNPLFNRFLNQATGSPLDREYTFNPTDHLVESEHLPEYQFRDKSLPTYEEACSYPRVERDLYSPLQLVAEDLIYYTNEIEPDEPLEISWEEAQMVQLAHRRLRDLGSPCNSWSNARSRLWLGDVLVLHCKKRRSVAIGLGQMILGVGSRGEGGRNLFEIGLETWIMYLQSRDGNFVFAMMRDFFLTS